MPLRFNLLALALRFELCDLNKLLINHVIIEAPKKTRAAGHPKAVDAMGCHKKGEQPKALIRLQGSI